MGIPPKQLSRQHLLAEHREIKRIPNAVRLGRANMNNIPAQFTLGTGHVKFFYNKLGYLFNRYSAIYWECLNRGYDVEYYGLAWDGVDYTHELWGNWEPTQADIELIKQRLKEKDHEWYKDQ